ncbi:PH domain-containing protein [Streptomyces sp. NPDC057939]|uniref:PH domain-containing protein n=1 Tax=Streptomyces sp. NPDC057939 TaxID=3346284 RepID=UPI0036F156D2
MGAGLLPREYRIRSARMVGVHVAVGIGAPCVLLTVATMEHVVTGVKLLIATLVVALFGWLVRAARRRSTAIDAEGIRVRRLTGSRRLAWADVQDIRAAPNPGAAMARNQPLVVSYAHDRTGRRIQLVYVDDDHVDVTREIALMRAAWRELRGPDWAPDPEVRRRIERQALREGRGEAAALRGWGTAGLLLAVGMVFLALAD